MNVYEERLTQADFPGRISQIRDAWAGLTKERESEVESSSPGLLDRLSKVLDFAGLIIERSDPELVAEDSIRELATLLTRLEAAAQSFNQDGSQTYLQTADSTIDSVLGLLTSFPGTSPKVTPQAISRAATTARNSFDKEISEFETKLSSLGIQVTEGSSSAQEKQEELGDRLTELQSSLESQRTQINDVIGTYQKQFSEQQDARANEFRTTLESLKTEFDEFSAGMEEKVQSLVDQVRSKKEQVDKFVEVAVATGTANAYGTEAKSQRMVANYLRGFAVVVALGAAAIAIGLVRETPGLEETLARALATVALTGIAGYLANQSGRHRGREERAKRIELELVSFDVVIQSLKDEKKNELRERYVEKLFQGDSAPPSDEQPALTEGSITALDQVVGVLKKLMK